MPTFLPLILVLDIVERTVARDFFNEDWAAYLARLARFSRVCKAMRNLVQLVLWSYLPPAGFEEPEERFVPHSGVRHLFKHVKGFWADYLQDYVPGRDEAEQSPFFVVLKGLPNVASVRLCVCDVSFENAARFADGPPPIFGCKGPRLMCLTVALRSLTIEDLSFGGVEEGLIFLHLETLSLFEVRTRDAGNICALLNASVTPALRQLFLDPDWVDWIEGARSSESYAPEGDVDLSRVTATQLQTGDGSATPYSFWEPENSISLDANVLISCNASCEEFFIDEYPDPFPPYFQLPDEELGGFKVAFLPSSLRNPADVDKRLRASVKSLCSARQQGGVKVVFFRETDETRGTISSAFLKYLEHPSEPDQNPLIVERAQQQRGASQGMRWTTLPGRHRVMKRK